MNFTLSPNLTALAYQQIPYTQFIGLEVCHEQERLLFHLPFQDMFIGNTLLPALQGGLIGGFIESCATVYLQQSAHIAELPKMIDFSLDYLRPGRPEAMYAACILTRQGTRIANVAIKVWQRHRDKPVAIGRAHFLMPDS